MAERDGYEERGAGRSRSRDEEPGRAGAFRGGQEARREAPGAGRSEFGGAGRSPSGAGPAYGSGSGGPVYGGDPGRGARDPRGAGYGGYGGTAGGASSGGARGGETTRGGWTGRERWESGGGSGYTGPSGLGWETDAGYGAGATGYGGSGRGALGEWSSRQGGGAGAAGSAGAFTRNRGPKGWQRSDERIHDDVCERLAGEPGIDPSEVTVEVRSGNVTLSGSVPDRAMKYRIEDIVDGCAGVHDVDNRLRVARGGMGGFLGTGTMGAGTSTDARGGAGGNRDSGSRGSLLGRLFGFTSGARLSDIMTRNPRTVSPDEPLSKVAQAMREQDVGAIPVCRGRTLAGMITDRDIVVRAAADGKPLDRTRVSEAMTTRVHTCYEDDEIESALDKMGDLQIRRIPVLDRSEQLVGIVSLGDFAQRETGDVEDALQDISKPS